MEIDVSKLRTDLPQVGVQPYRQVHAHSTGNRNSTVQNEADYHYRKDPELGFFSHVVGNGRVMQVGLLIMVPGTLGAVGMQKVMHKLN